MRPRRHASIAADARRKENRERDMAITRLLSFDSDEEEEVPHITRDLTIACVGCKYLVKNNSRFCSRTGSFFHMGSNYCKQHFGKITGTRDSQQGPAASSSDCNLVLFIPGSTECSICFCAIDEKDLTLTNCGHMFHHSCLLTWKLQNSTCPYCRRTTNPFRGHSSRMKLVKEIKPRSFC